MVRRIAECSDRGQPPSLHYDESKALEHQYVHQKPEAHRRYGYVRSDTWRRPQTQTDHDFGRSARVSNAEKYSGCDLRIRFFVVHETFLQRLLSAVMGVRARSMDAPVLWVQFDVPEEESVVAIPVSLVSPAERVGTTYSGLDTNFGRRCDGRGR